MIYLVAAILTVANAVFLALTFLTLPGNWLMVVAAALVAWWKWDAGMFSVWTLAAVTVLAVVGEVVEFFASAVAVRQSGGTRWGAVGSLIGAIVGGVVGTFAIPIPLVGSLIGLCGGACVGAWVCELAIGRGHKASARSGIAAGAGRLVASMAKFAVGVIIWTIITVAAFWP